MPTTGFIRGPNTWTVDQIRAAISRATQLNVIHEQRGARNYPHSFGNRKNTPLDSKCKQGDPNMMEFPIVASGPYNGGDPDADRVVYLHSPGDVDPVEGHPQSTYCGIMSHTGAPPIPRNGFGGCQAA
ncbi:hypothetical protein QQS21_009703 [Conoideocrella luteorostrata]|uniref:ribonuclease T1 n=1 Tax=Conoideocrella luteorostrata TaxID=1105319 RepID=A0AAJ0CKV2_9HYPO|nr:hypothetical protein QQS21_009703 [Conoideocrella luteorostrata]